MRLNLTQHNGTPAQRVTEPKNKKEVQNLLTFDNLPEYGEIENRAMKLAQIARREGATEAMIGGAPFLMPVLEKALVAAGIMPLYAFSKREVIETECDGGILKKTVFRHIGFVPAADTNIVDSCRRLICTDAGGYKKIVDGRIIYQAVSSHPWKKRAYTPQDCGPVAPGTTEAIEAAKKIKKIGDDFASALKNAEATKSRDWIESLPETIEIPWENNGRKGITLYKIDKEQGEILDQYGNFYLTLPTNPVHDIVDWIKENKYIPE